MPAPPAGHGIESRPASPRADSPLSPVTVERAASMTSSETALPAPAADPAPAGAEPSRPARAGDRRKSPTRRWSRYALWGGRRRGPRRDEEVEGSFVDQ